MSHENRIDLIRPDAPTLARRGPCAVGVQTHVLDLPPVADLGPRRLTVEMWYPAVEGTIAGTCYDTLLRDGVTAVRYAGSACRGAAPAQGPSAPFVVLSHGYPGNRYLMSHLAESLAAKGYVVAAPDHAGSTYDDQQDFGMTLLHRPLDQRGLIDAVSHMGGPVAALADTANTAVIGYSMGGYGAVVLGCAGLSAAALTYKGAPPDGALARHIAGSATHDALFDPRLKAIVPIGPWGNASGMWDAAGLAGLRVPMLLIAGTKDEVSDYGAMQRIFAGATQVERHMLSFTHAGHNAAAPVPAPHESWVHSDTLGWAPFAHYADPVWDTCRMNNIAQHFVAAFLARHLKGEQAAGAFLNGRDWPGFAPQTARGLTLEHLPAGGILTGA
ncbi:alpha/beta hydrolase family protein [Sulfitobacter sp. MF3-043]|uniref:alpha/beta hydrolase family protein n=1 Tax=Sulfitobacter sediminivivens TaxID=3252902 RepID=UPI0036D95CE1